MNKRRFYNEDMWEEAVIQAEAESRKQAKEILDSERPWEDKYFQAAVLNLGDTLDSETLAKEFFLASQQSKELANKLESELEDVLYYSLIRG